MSGILLVSLDPELTKLAKNIRNEIKVDFDIMELAVSTETPDEMVDVTLSESVKVIVARGGVVRYVREKYPIPIVEITFSFSNILNSIHEVVSKGAKKIALVSNSLIQTDNITFENIGGIKYSVKTFNSYLSYVDRKNVEHSIMKLIENGEIDALIRGNLEIPSAEKTGIIVSVLKSSEKEIKRALLEALSVVNNLKNAEKKNIEFETIINQTERCIITINNNNIIQNCNIASQRIFAKSINEILGQNINTLIPLETLITIRSEEKAKEGVVFDYQGVKLVAYSSSINVDGSQEGIIITVDRVSDIFDKELTIRKGMNTKPGLVARYTFKDLLGSSKIMHELLVKATRYAKSNEIILITGETGTGKELFAQSMHNASNFYKGPFVSVNCASLHDNLLESELFGYEEGAFTGALKGGKKGLFETAHRGTIFLDEISKTTPNFQANLLRVLQERQVRRIGGSTNIPIDVRIICSTNKDLEGEVKKGSFLEDLYYRISVLDIEVPPLRKRKEDILSLIIFFIKQECATQDITIWWKDDDIFKPFLQYNWPGNIRQLENIAKRIVISHGHGELTKDFINNILQKEYRVKTNGIITLEVRSSIKEMEKQMYEQLYQFYEGNKSRICQELDISRATLWRKLNKNE